MQAASDYFAFQSIQGVEYGLSVGNYLSRAIQSNFFVSNFRVDRVVRGSIADEAGISENDPVSISRLRILEEEGYALLEISVRKRRMGYLETSMQLPVWLDSPDTL